jgi:ATP-dependent exoDNAse (exonuclease V) beta subunit
VSPLDAVPAGDDKLRDDLRVEYDWVGLDARLAGTVVHRWLYRMAQDSVPAAGALPEGFDATTRRWLFELGAGPEVHPSIVSRVRAALQGVTNDARGRWILARQGAAELALTGVHGGRLRSIVVDRVRVDEEGCHWIVDYKTSTHEGGDLEGFLAAESRRYRAHLQTYAAIYANYAKVSVRAGLYFPLLARFVEIELD